MVRLFERDKDGKALRCLLCPNLCHINRGECGVCGVRTNTGETITLDTYGVISGFALDPVEKKPLYHYYPGKNILSVGSYGCNFRCDFCQNYHISQAVQKSGNLKLEPEELVARALKADNNIGIAYTYNEPVIWYEYVMDCAKLASSQGLLNVMVTNGYINKEPLNEMLTVIDAFNIDLKAFENDFYRRYTGATIKPVLETITEVHRAGRHLELTTLIIPGLNDAVDSMRREAEWIATSLGRSVPLHISRYFPMYRRTDPPTPAETILGLQEAASEYLDFVYTGNLAGTGCGSDTVCPKCSRTVIRRTGYITAVTGLDKEGICTYCSNRVIEYMK